MMLVRGGNALTESVIVAIGSMGYLKVFVQSTLQFCLR